MSTATSEQVCHISTESDIVLVRQAVREATVTARFSLVEQTKLVTAASELARNALVHGGGGRAEIAVRENSDGTATVTVTCTDEGPGIGDVEQALADGFSTGDGLGLGLGGARRLVHEFSIDSAPGRGTTVRIGATGPGARR
ncbi:serine/threonine-protein kinase RsbT [Amycolatopsis arida]|uniref:Serine/threonine-protein kinase RsbT n=1 Tax=Amycolatopsis arida TaxID=587909 RepID=A0A1I5V8B0_9PSEU|nr:ATP-binding protein [Amycolatopsis arida]TDX91186.1 serine/threonine-protein kinase RsbT [Amycolatopsis arida]SFQ03739.1 serine/threonine-protein kinase RsbT [Amycolatopsis arida]